MPDLSQIPTDQLQAMLSQNQSVSEPSMNDPVSTKSQVITPDLSKVSTEQLQSMLDSNQSKSTDTPSKILAGTASLARGAIEGIGQTLAAPGNILSQTIQGGLHLLDKAGIVPDSTYQNFKQSTAESRKLISEAGNKALDYVFNPAQKDIQANPNISKYSNLGSNMISSALTAGGLIGKLGAGLSPVTSGALTQGTQGALMGASANSEDPITSGIIGGAIGAPLGAIAGKFARSAEIINDKIDDIERVGMSPYSEAGIKSIKGALDSSGKELTVEEVERATKQALQTKLEAAAPKIDITQKPTDMIVNLAKANYPKIIQQQNALYAPLNESLADAPTPILSKTLGAIQTKAARELLPDLLPTNPTISDLMTYRRQISSGINQAERAIKMGSSTANFKSYQELLGVKQAVTSDLNAAAKASNPALANQLAAADKFHIDQVKPFDVYNTESGKLLSPQDVTDTWTRASKLLRPRLPNLTAMAQVAKTLGPEGKQVFGYAYLQQAVERSMNVDGRIFPTKISGELNKLQNSGLAQHILTPELSEAFNGMRNMAEGAIKTTRGMNTQSVGTIANFVNSLTHNSAGITLLRGLGSKTSSPSRIKNIISQVLTNALEKEVATPLPNLQQ